MYNTLISTKFAVSVWVKAQPTANKVEGRPEPKDAERCHRYIAIEQMAKT